LHFGRNRCGSIASRPLDRHRGRTGGPGKSEGDFDMATIGTFTRSENGFTGTIRTLTLNVKARFVAAAKENEKAPDYRVFTATGNTEFGAAWKKKAKETGREYFSVKLDDPSFPTPIHASLVEMEGGKEGYSLIWSR
jgi:uncharacterized protein (DUF736 family)